MRAHRLLCHLLVAAACLGGLGLVGATPAQAGCVGPEVSVEGQVLQREGSAPTQVRPQVAWAAGDRLTVRGTWFFDECQDTIATESGPGCSAPPPPPVTQPARDVRLVLTQAGRSWVLGTADAGPAAERFPVTWRVRLPAGVVAGPAELTAGGAPFPVLVTAPTG